MALLAAFGLATASCTKEDMETKNGCSHIIIKCDSVPVFPVAVIGDEPEISK